MTTPSSAKTVVLLMLPSCQLASKSSAACLKEGAIEPVASSEDAGAPATSVRKPSSDRIAAHLTPSESAKSAMMPSFTAPRRGRRRIRKVLTNKCDSVFSPLIRAGSTSGGAARAATGCTSSCATCCASTSTALRRLFLLLAFTCLDGGKPASRE
jgi:hypothetical protein